MYIQTDPEIHSPVITHKMSNPGYSNRVDYVFYLMNLGSFGCSY